MSFASGEDPLSYGSTVPDSPEPQTPLSRSLYVIAATMVGSALMVWAVNLDWVMSLLAKLINLTTVLIGMSLGYAVYNLLVLPRWSRLIVAVIICLTVTFCLETLTHSHKMVRLINTVEQDDD